MHRVDKPISEKSKGEIEKELEGKGDYVKMSYLQRALKSRLDFDTKKFCMLRLAGIYEGRRMYLEAARLIKTSADINVTFKAKKDDFMKAAQLYIQGGNYAEADLVFKQTLALGGNRDKEEMKNNFKNYYITQAKYFFSNDRRNYARIVFEKVLGFDLSEQERKEVQEHLIGLYGKLGMVKEFYKLKKSM